MFKISETSRIDISQPDIEASSDQLWETLDSNFSSTLPFLEETIDKWNSRTKLASTQTKNAGSSVFNATIIQQVNALLANPESKKRLIERTQSKRETFRILGRGAEDLHETKDVNIYNDHEFY